MRRCEDCRTQPRGENCRRCFTVSEQLLTEALEGARRAVSEHGAYEQQPAVLAVVADIEGRRRTERWR